MKFFKIVKTKYIEGDLVKRLPFDDTFKIISFTIKNNKIYYSLFNVTKNRHYSDVEEKYLQKIN
jgi:hypothetical protein